MARPQVGPQASAPPISGGIPVGARFPFGGARRAARGRTALDEARSEIERLRDQLIRLGALGVAELEARHQDLQHAVTDAEWRVAEVEGRQREAEQQLHDVHARTVVAEEEMRLQDAGVYRYRHPLDDSVAFRAELHRLQQRIRASVLKGAVTWADGWADLAQLLLHAYNMEADALVRTLTPAGLGAAEQRLEQTRASVERLGAPMGIALAYGYHQERLRELELTADHRQKVADEKERERVGRARLREEHRVQREIQTELARLIDQEQRCDPELLHPLEQAIDVLDDRAASLAAGYVYVASNAGAFGEGVLLVGVTRRLDPLSFIAELGSDSAPFPFARHALFYSDDAAGAVARLRERLDGRRVNHSDPDRGFFYATPAEVEEHLAAVSPDLVRFDL